MMTEVLAIIPARGGSKSIPNKNIALVGGEPLLHWTISAARKSRHLSRTIVSTDDDAITAVARQHGANVPFKRPASLARDDTPGIDPILHALSWFDQQERYHPDWVMMLQPTSPLRTTADIDGAITIMQKQKADGVVSVMPVDHHPYWMKEVDADGRMRNFISIDPPILRRQDLPPLYALNGAIYLAKRELLLREKSWYTANTFAYIMPTSRSLDVDTPWDLEVADLLLRNRGNYAKD
jgi:CMP-N,N'-diacetyllegionaminic acid synthase